MNTNSELVDVFRGLDMFLDSGSGRVPMIRLSGAASSNFFTAPLHTNIMPSLEVRFRVTQRTISP